MTFDRSFEEGDYEPITLEEAQDLNIFLINNKSKWTAKELLVRTRFCKTWNTSVCIAEVAARTNTSSTKVLKLSAIYKKEGFKLIKFDPTAKWNRTTYVPTPEQIKEETRKIKQTWSKSTENARRRCDWRTEPVIFNEVTSKLNRKLASNNGKD